MSLSLVLFRSFDGGAVFMLVDSWLTLMYPRVFWSRCVDEKLRSFIYSWIPVPDCKASLSETGISFSEPNECDDARNRGAPW